MRSPSLMHHRHVLFAANDAFRALVDHLRELVAVDLKPTKLHDIAYFDLGGSESLGFAHCFVASAVFRAGFVEIRVPAWTRGDDLTPYWGATIGVYEDV